MRKQRFLITVKISARLFNATNMDTNYRYVAIPHSTQNGFLSYLSPMAVIQLITKQFMRSLEARTIAKADPAKKVTKT